MKAPKEAGEGLPPVDSNDADAPTPTIPCVPAAVVQYIAEPGAEQSDPNIFNPPQSVTSTSSSKRAWSDEDSSSTGVLENGVLLVKKCKNCDRSEELLLKAEAELTDRALKILVKKEAQLMKHQIYLDTVIRDRFTSLFAANRLDVTPEQEDSLLGFYGN